MSDQPSRWNELQKKLKERAIKMRLTEHAEEIRKEVRRELKDEFNAPLTNHLPVELFDELVIQDQATSLL